MASVTLRGVTKSFGTAAVLSGVDLDVDDGSTLSLLGPSGSGKSTLLRIVAGLESVDAGSVVLGGDDVADRPVHRRGVGFVFQDQALFPHFDVGGNVAYGLRMAGVGRSERAERVADALDAVGLPGFEGRDPATLSGGEAQRVALARALAPRPEVILLDEPLAALDQLLRERLLLELRSLFDSLEVTVIAVTHDPTEAGALGSRLAVLLDGRVAQVDDPGAVLDAPASAAVAGLVGHRNVADASVADGTVVSPWGRFPAVDSVGDPGDDTDSEVAVLVRPDGVVADAEGPLAGTVTGRIFRGGSAFAVVEGRSWPALDVRADARWQVGDQVQLRIEPAAVHLMAR